MRLFRLFLLMLLCLAVPLQGIANVHMLSAPCPMEQPDRMAQTKMANMDMDIQTMVDHDCCNDIETITKTGKVCKTGQDCPVSALYPASFAASLSVPLAPATLHSFLVLSVRSFDASSVWRPPTRA